MASISEKTHAKNLENLHIAITIVASVGSAFNPNKELIKADSLTRFEATFAALMQAVNEVLPNEQNAVGEQLAKFKDVSRRVTKIMNAAKGQGQEDFLFPFPGSKTGESVVRPGCSDFFFVGLPC